MAAYLETASNSAYDVFLVLDLVVYLVFSYLGFLEWEFISDCAVS